MRLNAAERGIFWELIFYCYKEGSVPDDPILLARICDVPIEDLNAAWPNVSKSFQLKGGEWHNRKVDEELPAIERRYEQKREAGLASAQRKLNGRSADVQRKLNARLSESPTIEAAEAVAVIKEQSQTLARAGWDGDALFAELFAAYPEHRSDDSHLTQAAFVELMAPVHPDDRAALQVEILDGIERGKASDDWQRENGRFVPSLKNFLAEKQWKRKFRAAKKPETQAERVMRLLEERERQAAQ